MTWRTPIACVAVALLGCKESIDLDDTSPPDHEEDDLSVSTGPGVLVASPPDPALPFETPALAVAPSGAVFVTWVAEDEDGFRDIYVARSDDAGSTFADPIAVGEPQDPTEGWPRAPAALATNDALWVGFAARDKGVTTSLFLYRAPIDHPEAFTLATRITMPVGYHDLVYPRLAAHPDGDLWAAWITTPTGFEGELWVARERQGWNAENITASSGLQVPCECCPPDLYITEDGAAWVAWRGDVVRDVYVAHTDDPDAHFSAHEQVVDLGVADPVCPLDGPALLEVDGTLHVALSDTNVQGAKAWLASRQTAGGWEVREVPDDGLSHSRVFAVADAAGAIHLGYETRYEGPYRVSRLAPGAKAFGEAVDVVGPTGPLHHVRAGRLGDGVAAVGVDDAGSVWLVRPEAP